MCVLVPVEKVSPSIDTGETLTSINTQLMFFEFFYWLGLGTTVFSLALLLVGGLGDYLKNIFMLQQKHLMVMVIGCLLSVIPYVRPTSKVFFFLYPFK